MKYIEPITVMSGSWDYEEEIAFLRQRLIDFRKHAMIYEGLEIRSIIVVFESDVFRCSIGFSRYSVSVFGV